MSDFLEEEINKKFPMGMENFDKSVKSLTITGSIEKTELRIEMNHKKGEK